MLTIGSVWENKIKTDNVVGDVITIPNIVINDSKTKIFNIRKSLSDTEMKFIIPRYEWEVLSSNCLAIEYNNDPYGIIIPCAEIARFYYCRSTTIAAMYPTNWLKIAKEITIAEVMGTTLLLAWTGETSVLFSTPILVRPVAVAMSVDVTAHFF